MKNFTRLIIFLIGATFLFWAISLVRATSVTNGPIANIDGITFPVDRDSILITEKLAHTDIYLNRSRFARRLRITVSFSPLTTTDLALGLRDNSFWLSYNKISLCCSAAELSDPNDIITKSVSIPTTDKLADRDRSLDLMFFASHPASLATEDEGLHDQTTWLLHRLSITAYPAWPDRVSLYDYLRSTLTREKVL